MSFKNHRTEVRVMLQGTGLTYYSTLPSGEVVAQLTGGHPVFLETEDGHCAIVNPDQIPAMEVYDI